MKMNCLTQLIVVGLLSAAASLKVNEIKAANGEFQSRAFPCPDAPNIAPCVCSNPAEGLMLNCNTVTSDQQLSAVFQADFPVTDFYKLEIKEANITKLGSDLDTLTFREIDVSSYTIQLVVGHFLRASADTLEKLTVSGTSVTEDTFPFYDLEFLFKLNTINLYLNRFTSLPPLSSASIEYMDFTHNQIASLDSGIFNGTTALKKFTMIFNALKEILPGTIFFPPSMIELQIQTSTIQTIHSGALALQETSSLQRLDFYDNSLTELLPQSIVIPTTLEYLDFTDMFIETVHPGAFVVSAGTELAPLTVILAGNRITTLDQDAFEDLFMRATTVNLNVNPLACGCDLYWLISNPTYMSKLGSCTCADNTLVTDLDVPWFDQYC